MAARTDVDKIRAIVDVDDFFIEEDEDMDPFIQASDLLLDWVASKQTGDVPVYSKKTFSTIATWLSAHCYCILDPQRVREEVSTVREVFQQQVNLGLDQTRYGQMAKLLDTQGWLAGLDNAQKAIKVNLAAKRKVGAVWLGREYTGDGSTR